MNNLIRFLAVSIYPLILLLSFFYLFHNNNYRTTIQRRWRYILLNSFLFAIIGSLAITVFFLNEDTVYSYDYAGHWIRSLELREVFFENPSEIFSTVYSSMLNSDYSYLPALFGLGMSFLNTSYGYFALTIFLYFLIPVTILIQIIYFKFVDKYPYLPLFCFIVFYPLYISIFYGEVDVIGLFFVILLYMSLIIPNFNDIKWNDILFSNIFTFTSIFLRRWYIYPIFAIYLLLFIKFVLFHRKKLFSINSVSDLIKILFSGLPALIIIVIFFRPFFLRILTSNYAEAYAYYDKDGSKLLALLNFYSPLILLISSYGLYSITRKYIIFLLYILISIFIPLAMFWSIQSFEYHHYHIINGVIILLFIFGAYALLEHKNKVIVIVFCILLTIQALSIYFIPFNTMPLMTNIRKRPERIDYKDGLKDFAYYLKSLMPEEWQSAYMASGSTAFNSNLIRNSILPDLDAPNFDSAELDLRDGFPKNIEYIQYIITTDPILYLDENYQKIYNVISYAIKNEPIIKDAYKLIFNGNVLGFNVQVYERIADYTPAMKEYFYKQMLSYYPDHQDYFAYILE